MYTWLFCSDLDQRHPFTHWRLLKYHSEDRMIAREIRIIFD